MDARGVNSTPGMTFSGSTAGQGDCAHACGSGDRERARPCGRRYRIPVSLLRTLVIARRRCSGVRLSGIRHAPHVRTEYGGGYEHRERLLSE